MCNENLYKIQYDCTFETTPIGFYQVFNILGSHAGAKFLLWTVLLTSKTAPLYTAVLQRFKEEYPQVNPKLIQSDYEAALNLAAKIVYPKASVRGCWLHFASACFKKCQEMGLVKYLNTDPKMRRIIRKVMSLPILPADKIADQVDLLLTTSVLNIADKKGKALITAFFFDYLIPFWIEKIGPSRLSVYGCPDKTNNACEQMHSLMHFNLPHHCKIFVYLYHLHHNIFESQERNLKQVENGLDIAFKHAQSLRLQE